jgi:type IV pilus assembly protein PilW
MRRPASRGRRTSHGLTLVELLISMVVSLFVTLAVYQTFAASEGYRRSATSGGDAVFNGSIAMHTLQRDLRMAGYGLNSTVLLGCRVLAYDEGVAPPRDFNFTLVPVLITQGAGAAPDTVEISFSSTESVPVPVRLTQALPTPAANYHVDNAFGLDAGQLIIVGEAGQDCILQQVTNTPSQEAPGRRDLVIHNSGMYRTPSGAMAAARYNKPGGFGPAYSLDAVIYPIGRTPSVARYSIQNENLVLDPVLQGTAPLPVAAGIVQLQAQYGRDTNGDGAVDVWDENSPATPNDWAGVIAVRLGLVARSSVAERPDADGNCTTTTAAPTWVAGAFDLSARADWRCFRYRVFEATVSLRNMIWRPV